MESSSIDRSPNRSFSNLKMADRGKTSMAAEEEYQLTRANGRTARVTTNGLRRFGSNSKHRAFSDSLCQGRPPAFFTEDSSSTLVNVNDMRVKSTRKLKDVEISHGYIQVTILVAAEGEHMLPSLKCSTNLKTSLENLASILIKNLMGVEVLWTPQQENGRLSKQELNDDYPLLSQPFVLGMSGEMDDEYCL